MVRLGLLLSVSICVSALGQATRPTAIVPTPPLIKPPPPPASAPADAPRVELSTRLWDFGTIWFGDPCTIDIAIKNVGKSPLTIVNLKSSCGCTAARPPKNVLAPGESDKITITYNSKKGSVNVGQTITLETNDPAEPSIPIHVKGIVQPLYEAKPASMISFGTIPPGHKQSMSLELTNKTGAKLGLKLAPQPAGTPAFDLQLETITEGQHYRLTATTRPPMNMGSASMLAKLHTDDPKRPEFDIHVNAMVSDRVAINPQSIYFSATGTPGPQTRMLRVNFQKDRPLTIKSITCTIPSVTIKQMPVPAADSVTGMFNYYPINVTLPDWKELPDAGGQIEIDTDDAEPKFQKLVVPIIKYSPPGASTQPVVKPVPPASKP
jgi:Protein of unknown function (DUF1573)